MTIAEVMKDYANNKTDAIATIRTLTGAFNPEIAVDLLAIICTITRVEQGDLDRDLFKKIWKLEEGK